MATTPYASSEREGSGNHAAFGQEIAASQKVRSIRAGTKEANSPRVVEKMPFQSNT